MSITKKVEGDNEIEPGEREPLGIYITKLPLRSSGRSWCWAISAVVNLLYELVWEKTGHRHFRPGLYQPVQTQKQARSLKFRI